MSTELDYYSTIAGTNSVPAARFRRDYTLVIRFNENYIPPIPL